MPPQVLPIADPADPRLADYRDLPEHLLRESSGRFVAESEVVVRKLLASRLRVLSILVTPPRLRALAAALPEGVPVYLAEQAVMDQVAGFHVHRGCLAVAQRPESGEVPPGAQTLAVLEDLVDVVNLGAMVRNAAALGADALLLSPQCADPFYRRAVRVSAGHVFSLPIVRAAPWPGALGALRAGGFQIAGAVAEPDALPLPRWRPRGPVAVVLGSEGPGLGAATRAACDVLVTVPMRPAADSLNVAVAGAIVLYHLDACRRSP